MVRAVARVLRVPMSTQEEGLGVTPVITGGGAEAQAEMQPLRRHSARKTYPHQRLQRSGSLVLLCSEEQRLHREVRQSAMFVYTMAAQVENLEVPADDLELLRPYHLVMRILSATKEKPPPIATAQRTKHIGSSAQDQSPLGVVSTDSILESLPYYRPGTSGDSRTRKAGQLYTFRNVRVHEGRSGEELDDGGDEDEDHRSDVDDDGHDEQVSEVPSEYEPLRDGRGRASASTGSGRGSHSSHSRERSRARRSRSRTQRWCSPAKMAKRCRRFYYVFVFVAIFFWSLFLAYSKLIANADPATVYVAYRAQQKDVLFQVGGSLQSRSLGLDVDPELAKKAYEQSHTDVGLFTRIIRSSSILSRVCNFLHSRYLFWHIIVSTTFSFEHYFVTILNALSGAFIAVIAVQQALLYRRERFVERLLYTTARCCPHDPKVQEKELGRAIRTPALIAIAVALFGIYSDLRYGSLLISMWLNDNPMGRAIGLPAILFFLVTSLFVNCFIPLAFLPFVTLIRILNTRYKNTWRLLSNEHCPVAAVRPRIRDLQLVVETIQDRLTKAPSLALTALSVRFAASAYMFVVRDTFVDSQVLAPWINIVLVQPGLLSWMLLVSLGTLTDQIEQLQRVIYRMFAQRSVADKDAGILKLIMSNAKELTRFSFMGTTITHQTAVHSIIGAVAILISFLEDRARRII